MEKQPTPDRLDYLIELQRQTLSQAMQNGAYLRALLEQYHSDEYSRLYDHLEKSDPQRVPLKKYITDAIDEAGSTDRFKDQHMHDYLLKLLNPPTDPAAYPYLSLEGQRYPPVSDTPDE